MSMTTTLPQSTDTCLEETVGSTAKAEKILTGGITNTDKTKSTDNSRYETYETYNSDKKTNRNKQHDFHPNTEIWTQKSTQKQIDKLVFDYM